MKKPKRRNQFIPGPIPEIFGQRVNTEDGGHADMLIQQHKSQKAITEALSKMRPDLPSPRPRR